MQHSSQNVTGMERKLSIAGGLGLLACGLRHGGVGGLLALAAGGMALYRGLTGHCELKERLCERHSGDDIARYAHMPMDSEVRSPDFRNPETGLPDSTPWATSGSPTPPERGRHRPPPPLTFSPSPEPARPPFAPRI